ncbi:AAA family ATPase [Candidatus Pacearchaeota archaeon]|nr:AAA family ATPase [Candidatus Pacearchaeota archaeon]
MSKLHIFIGNIGSGKGVLASRFAKDGAVVVNMDSIQQMVGGGEYGLYDNNKKEVYHNIESTAIQTSLRTGNDVVVDRTNMDKKRRARYIEYGKRFGCKVIAYDWGPGYPECLERRLDAPNGIPATTWEIVFHTMSQNYEKASLDEGFDTIFTGPERYKFYAFDFDGTIVENQFPEIGPVIPETVSKIKTLWQDQENIIIIWTCRAGNLENKARAFLLKNKIPFNYINENPLFDVGGRKIFAHEYIDDRNQ